MHNHRAQHTCIALDARCSTIGPRFSAPHRGCAQSVSRRSENSASEQALADLPRLAWSLRCQSEVLFNSGRANETSFPSEDSRARRIDRNNGYWVGGVCAVEDG